MLESCFLRIGWKAGISRCADLCAAEQMLTRLGAVVALDSHTHSSTAQTPHPPIHHPPSEVGCRTPGLSLLVPCSCSSAPR